MVGKKMVEILKFVYIILLFISLFLVVINVDGKHDYHMYFQRIPCPEDQNLYCSQIECWCK
ncbi:putative Late nodulin [Medicago truncatula]|uniref:Putative Late nodulin n=1 Tax=Medicago truncatula TaxID=3880 RepID=A0A396HH27_MEDTR|nr:putative Late nodulin [Medicago truncatula]